MKSQIKTIAILLIFFTAQLFGQSPYKLDRKKEMYFIGAGITTLGLGTYLNQTTPSLTLVELEDLKSQSVNNFDRVAINNYSTSAQQASDLLWFGSTALPTLFLTNKNTRKDFGTIAALWGETALLNFGLTVVSKYSIRRARPFVYNPDVSTDLKTVTNARASFFSGHTSMAAANSFFAAKVFSDYYPDSKWKPVIWTAAATLPALTGYLRVKAGKHYPTDVITGYAVGAAIGYLVPHFHKQKSNGKGLEINGGISGVLLRYTF